MKRLCNSQWRPSIHLIGWLSRYISDVGRQSTSESFDWARAFEAVRRFFYTAVYVMSCSLLSGNPGYMSNWRRSLIESVSRHYVWGAYKTPLCEKTAGQFAHSRCWGLGAEAVVRQLTPKWRHCVRSPFRYLLSDCALIYFLSCVFLLSLFTHITYALISYNKRILLDIGQRYTNLLQDTLSTNPTWPLEILRSVEKYNGHLNNPLRQWIKKYHEKRTGNRNRLRERAHSPPLPSILLTNVQSLRNKMDS